MIVVKKRMKKPLKIAIIAGVLLVLTVAAILLNTLLMIDNGEGENTKPPIDVMESLGEATHNGAAVAYPYVEEDSIEMIDINGQYKYSLTRIESVLGEDSKKLAPFMLSYTDELGNEMVYAPNIMQDDPTFSYEDTYATTSGEGLGNVEIYKLTYLCTAIGTTYFSGRIKLSDAYDVRQEELATFGLSQQDDPVTVRFYYYDENKELQQRTIKIGEKIITDGGYYFTVDDRRYVYASSNPYIEYALKSFTEYIKPLMVSAGLPQDNAFEPYLTTDFQQWKNTVYDDEGIDRVVAGSHVAVNASKIESVFNVDKDQNKKYDYKTEEAKKIIFELSRFEKDPMTNRFSTALQGVPVGDCEDPISITTYAFSTPITVGEGGAAVEYTYRIKIIESILTNTSEITEKGALVGDNDLIKVTYELYFDGVNVTNNDLHGVLDLTSPLISDEVEAKLRASAVGIVGAGTELNHIDVNMVYTDDTVVKNNVSIVITEIIDISDSNGMKLESVVDGATVMFRYYVVTNGKRDENPTTSTIKIGDDLEEDEALIAKLIMGKTVADGYNINVAVYSVDCEIMATYTTYVVDRVDYFYTRENIVSFEFAQASDRDVYYGESFYANTMTGKYSMYALNASACQAVVELLGGLNESATASVGFEGLETVSIGITPEKIKKYGLYANTVYFEIPRGISAIDYGDTPSDNFFANLDDYTYYDTLGFTLYVSDKGIDGKRYIASEAYDIISVVDGDAFVFLDETFVDFYARRNIVMANISAINNIKLEFYMDDLYGTYSNELKHNNLYAYAGKLYRKEELTEDELAMATEYDAIDVLVTPSGECFDTAFSDYLDKNGYTYISLREFYNNEYVELESRGTANFKEWTETLFFMGYQGTLTEEEQATGFERGKLLMKMTVRLYDGYGAYQYAYEFHKISDRKIMVKLYRENIVDGSHENEVSDFYISTFAFEKLAGLYVSILEGEDITNKTPIVDIK